MCGSFCHFLFLFAVIIIVYFEDQYFHSGVLFWRTFSKDAGFVFVL